MLFLACFQQAILLLKSSKSIGGGRKNTRRYIVCFLLAAPLKHLNVSSSNNSSTISKWKRTLILNCHWGGCRRRAAKQIDTSHSHCRASCSLCRPTILQPLFFAVFQCCAETKTKKCEDFSFRFFPEIIELWKGRGTNWQEKLLACSSVPSDPGRVCLWYEGHRGSSNCRSSSRASSNVDRKCAKRAAAAAAEKKNNSGKKSKLTFSSIQSLFYLKFFSFSSSSSFEQCFVPTVFCFYLCRCISSEKHTRESDRPDCGRQQTDWHIFGLPFPLHLIYHSHTLQHQFELCTQSVSFLPFPLCPTVLGWFFLSSAWIIEQMNEWTNARTNERVSKR